MVAVSPKLTLHMRLGPPLRGQFHHSFLQYVSGMRALLALVVGAACAASAPPSSRVLLAILALYVLWAAFLFYLTVNGSLRASAPSLVWIDAAMVLLVVRLGAPEFPVLYVFTALPVVALALLAGPLHAAALAAACALAVSLLAGWRPGLAMPATPAVAVSLGLLAFSPAVAFLAGPGRQWRRRHEMLDTLNERSDPRKGLRHHVDVLLDLLGTRLALSQAVMSLHGPEPRIFLWSRGNPVRVLTDDEAQAWQLRLSPLPSDASCLCTHAAGGLAVTAVQAQSGAAWQVTNEARHAMETIGGPALSLPLVSYGRPNGQLWLRRESDPFLAADVRWLHGVMAKVLPLLERADLLEQLQRETAARERERIGRDLHDSAVQPYLGLKYGLEALARQAGPNNPVHPNIQQLLRLASDELQTLRDVVSGLRSGDDPAAPGSASLDALQRQVERFQALYGLKVNIFAPQAPRLRGSAARAILHMVNEALTNVRRHTSATAVTILLDVVDNEVVMRMRNDHGHGERLPENFLPRSLAERAADFGGGVAVTHEPDFTEISIRLPLWGAIG